MCDDIPAVRSTLFGLLDGIADGGVHFPAYLEEYLCMWFTDLFWRPLELVKDGVISEEEYQVLSRFSEVFRATYPKGEPVGEVDTTKLQDDLRWKSVVKAAREARSELRSLTK